MTSLKPSWLTIALLYMAIATLACQPGEEISPSGEEPAAQEDDEMTTEGEAPMTEAQEVQLEEPVRERRGVEGRRLSIDADSTRLSPGESSRLAASVVTVDGADPVELQEPVDYRWHVPEGWEIDGDGNEIVVIAPDGDSADSGDVRVAIEDATGFRIRGGMPIFVE